MGVSTRRSLRLAKKGDDDKTPATSTPSASGGVRKTKRAKRVSTKPAPKPTKRGTSSSTPSKSAAPSKKKAPSGVFPTCTVKDEDGNEVNTATVYSESAFVVFLYPRANTPGCTTQACGFRDMDLQKFGYKVFGLSYDSPKSQTNWKNKHTLGFSLWCDTPGSGSLITQLGAHKSPKGIKRSHFVVAKGGKIIDTHIQISPKASIASAMEFCKNNPAETEPTTAPPNGEAMEVVEKDEDVEMKEEENAKGDAKATKKSKKAEDKESKGMKEEKTADEKPTAEKDEQKPSSEYKATAEAETAEKQTEESKADDTTGEQKPEKESKMDATPAESKAKIKKRDDVAGDQGTTSMETVKPSGGSKAEAGEQQPSTKSEKPADTGKEVPAVEENEPEPMETTPEKPATEEKGKPVEATNANAEADKTKTGEDAKMEESDTGKDATKADEVKPTPVDTTVTQKKGEDPLKETTAQVVTDPGDGKVGEEKGVESIAVALGGESTT